MNEFITDIPPIIIPPPTQLFWQNNVSADSVRVGTGGDLGVFIDESGLYAGNSDPTKAPFLISPSGVVSGWSGGKTAMGKFIHPDSPYWSSYTITCGFKPKKMIMWAFCFGMATYRGESRSVGIWDWNTNTGYETIIAYIGNQVNPQGSNIDSLFYIESMYGSPSVSKSGSVTSTSDTGLTITFQMAQGQATFIYYIIG